MRKQWDLTCAASRTKARHFLDRFLLWSQQKYRNLRLWDVDVVLIPKSNAHALLLSSKHNGYVFHEVNLRLQPIARKKNITGISCFWFDIALTLDKSGRQSTLVLRFWITNACCQPENKHGVTVSILLLSCKSAWVVRTPFVSTQRIHTYCLPHSLDHPSKSNQYNISNKK